ncbi:hypothetical protein OG322_26165 [Streptomyces sp. NBC_01260]|uniref:hypothetical protein n=1 Tax=Streptomyces sp. NBC_01260 TaxID=2903801 RepID=UPI002E3057BF|nr:hypothetical protein [Streptomyces sp. NBC_01260]
MNTRTRPVRWLAFVSADPVTGLRRGPIRWPDGTPPPPFGCRWCGHDPAMHGMGAHSWERPTDAQMVARMKAPAGRPPASPQPARRDHGPG